MKTSVLDALRLVLPYAERAANDARTIAQAAHDLHKPDVTCMHFASDAEVATSAVTAARMALQDAAVVRCHVAYRVTFAEVRVHGGSTCVLRHAVEVLAEGPEDAQDRAIAACEAAGLIHGDILRLERIRC